MIDGTLIIGKHLAIELGVVVGDRVNVLSSSFISTPLGPIPKQSSYGIAAVFSSGLYEFDKSIAFFNLKRFSIFLKKLPKI